MHHLLMLSEDVVDATRQLTGLETDRLPHLKFDLVFIMAGMQEYSGDNVTLLW